MCSSQGWSGIWESKGYVWPFSSLFFFQLLWCGVITELAKLDQGFRLFPWAVWHFLFNSSVFELPSNTQSVLISAICCLLWDYEEVTLLSGLEFSCLTCLSETAGWSLSVESKFACYIFHVVAKTMVVCVNSCVWSNMAVWCGQRPKKERKKTNVEFQRWVLWNSCWWKMKPVWKKPAVLLMATGGLLGVTQGSTLLKILNIITQEGFSN